MIERVINTPVTIEEWIRQREYMRSAKTDDVLALGFCAFSLNRTNRSGIIKGGGVIGGLEQTGNYKIDCRYNAVGLAQRIKRIKKYEDRIYLTNLDAIDFLDKCERDIPQESLLFVDPPYFNKGSSLYMSFYRSQDHGELAERIVSLDRPWVVTYDDTPEIRALYKERRQYCFDINYSLQEKRIGTELLIASKGLIMPDTVKARQVNRPQYRKAA